MIFQECSGCVATPFCLISLGSAKKPDWTWCRAKFRLYKALELSRIPERYLNASKYNYQKDNENKLIYSKLEPYLENIVQFVDEGVNFLLYGEEVGTGKTYTAAALLNQFIYKTCLTDRFDFENPLGLFISFPSIMDDLRYRRDTEEAVLKMRQINTTPLLLLDDVGSGTISDFVIEQMYLIIDHRFRHKLSTIITSNFKISVLVDSLGERIVSRLRNDSVSAKFAGEDRRVKRG